MPNTPLEPIDLTIRDACAVLQRSRSSLYNDIKSGALITYKIGRSTRIRRDSVEALRRGGAK